MVLHRNPERTKKVIQRLLQWYKKRTGIFSGTGLPETVLPEGVQPGSDEHIMFITMCSTLDYSRNADALWDAGRKTWADESTRWVFFPHQVEKKTFDDLKKERYKKVTEYYLKFVDKYPNSSFITEAEKMYVESLNLLTKFAE